MAALAALRRHPAPALLVVAVLAVSLTLIGTWSVARAQVGMLEDWYSSGLPLGRGTEAAMAAKLLGWGRQALAAFVAAGILALLVAVQVAMGVTRMTRRDDIRELRVTGASRSAIRWSFLAQGAALGLAGALVAFVLVGVGTWLLMRHPAAEPAFASLPMVGVAELLRVLPVLVVTGLAASGAGTLLGARDLLRR